MAKTKRSRRRYEPPSAQEVLTQEYPPALLSALNNLWRQGRECLLKGQSTPVLVVVLHPSGDLVVEGRMTVEGLAPEDRNRWRHLMSMALEEAAENLRPKPEDVAQPRVM